MYSYLLKSKSVISFAFAVSLFLFTGCSEDPNRAAQKEAAKAVSAALEAYKISGNFEDAQKQLNSLSSEAAGRDVAVFLKAGFSYSSASKILTQLPADLTAIDVQIAKLSKLLSNINSLQNEKSNLDLSLASHQQIIASLNTQLNGDSNQPGLLADAKQLQTVLAELKEQKESFDKQTQESQAKATALQKQADELLLKAQTAQAEEKESLQNQAYTLLKGSSTEPSQAKLLAQAQNFADQSALVQSKINEAQPKLDYLQNAIKTAQQRLAELENSTLPSDIQTRLAQIDSETSQLKQDCQASLSLLQETQQKYQKDYTDAAELYQRAQKDFRSAANDIMDQIAKIAAADTAFKSGLAASQHALSLNNLAARVSVLPQVEGISETVTSIAQNFGSSGKELIAKAIEDYNDAANGYDRIRDRNINKVIKANQLLALGQMAYLAQAAELPQVADDSLVRAQELLTEAIESDRTFIKTPAAQFYYKLTGTTPPPVELPKAPEVEANEPADSEVTPAPPTDGNVVVEEPAMDFNDANSIPAELEPNTL